MAPRETGVPCTHLLTWQPLPAGDIVQFKKPAPDVYNLAANTLMVKPEDCMVIEDSTIGLAAAKAALMSCIVTKSTVTSVLPGLCSPELICAYVLV